ncbi:MULTISPECIES: hypothetical protein [Lactococcus]|nr:MULTISPECIES: hypothetical protein [Lactococcus]
MFHYVVHTTGVHFVSIAKATDKRARSKPASWQGEKAGRTP